jgi:Arc/MetJ family transcription regulator
MHDGRENQPHGDEKNQTSIERVQAGKQLSAIGFGCIYRAHATHQHGCVQECIAPQKVLKVHVAGHADEQGNTEQSDCCSGMKHHAPNESPARKRWMGFVFVHDCDLVKRNFKRTMCIYIWSVHMRTNIVIDDKLMADALKLTGARTKREAVELGLKTLLRSGRQAEIKRLRGKIAWQGDLDSMRRDK